MSNCQWCVVCHIDNGSPVVGPFDSQEQAFEWITEDNPDAQPSDYMVHPFYTTEE